MPPLLGAGALPAKGASATKLPGAKLALEASVGSDRGAKKQRSAKKQTLAQSPTTSSSTLLPKLQDVFNIQKSKCPCSESVVSQICVVVKPKSPN